MSILTQLFMLAYPLPPALAVDLVRLRKALSLLGTPEKEILGFVASIPLAAYPNSTSTLVIG